MNARFSGRVRWPARPNDLALLRARLLRSGAPLIDLSDSNPTRTGLTEDCGGGVDWPLGLLADPANRVYSPDPRGLARAREALASRYAKIIRPPGRAPGAEDFFLCSSTSEAYSWLFKLLCDPGDAILAPRPGYPLFDYLAALESVEARGYRLEYAHPSGWRVDLDSVRDAMRDGKVRAVVVINPNNPTGSYLGSSERRALAGICAEAGCALIADEVFFGYRLEAAGDGPAAPESCAGEGGCLTFALDGLSKLLGLPQMKLGWIACSGPRRDLAEAAGRLEIIADSYLSAGAPPMNALPALLEDAEAFAARAGERLARNLGALRGILEGDASPHRVLRCAGGWTALIESPRLAPEEELAAGLLREAGVWAQPGYFFDMEREAFFAASLILRPEVLADGAARYARYFAALQQG